MTDETRSLIYNCGVTSDDAQRICEILWFEHGPVNELHERAGGCRPASFPLSLSGPRPKKSWERIPETRCIVVQLQDVYGEVWYEYCYSAMLPYSPDSSHCSGTVLNKANRITSSKQKRELDEEPV